MGHGALQVGAVSAPPELLTVIGPRRALLEGSRLHPYLAVPHGDMMLAGCFGLLRALAARVPAYAPAIEDQLGTLKPILNTGARKPRSQKLGRRHHPSPTRVPT